jgi:chromosome segregation ATPase
MNITNDSTGSPDYIGYFTKQFLTDLGRMAELRDELAKRQGALSAVEATIKAKNAADVYALGKKVDADAILEKAKDAKATAEALVAELKNNGAELEARIAVNDAELAQREKDVATREKKVQANATALDLRFGELKAENDKLDAATAALDARIKAFQDSIKNI